MKKAPMHTKRTEAGREQDAPILALRADLRHLQALAREVQALHDHVVRLLRQLNPVRCTTITEAAQ